MVLVDVIAPIIRFWYQNYRPTDWYKKIVNFYPLDAHCSVLGMTFLGYSALCYNTLYTIKPAVMTGAVPNVCSCGAVLSGVQDWCYSLLQYWQSIDWAGLLSVCTEWHGLCSTVVHWPSTSSCQWSKPDSTTQRVYLSTVSARCPHRVVTVMAASSRLAPHNVKLLCLLFDLGAHCASLVTASP